MGGTFNGATFNLPGGNWIYLSVSWSENVSGTTNNVSFSVNEYSNYGISGTWNTKLTVDGNVIWNGNCTWNYPTANARDGHPAGSGSASFTYSGSKSISVVAEITNMDYSDIHGGGSTTGHIDASATISLTNTNNPPNAPTLTLSPSNNFGDEVLATITGSDPDGDAITYNLYGWLLDSAGNHVHWDNIADGSDCIMYRKTFNTWTLDTRGVAQGQRIELYATVTDSHDATSSGSGYIIATKHVNTPPTAPNSVSASGVNTAYATNSITVSWNAGSDADGDTIGYDIYYTSNYPGKTDWYEISSYQSATSCSFSLHDNGIPEGYAVKFRVCTSDGKATSGYTESNYVTHNRIPSAPGNFKPSGGIYYSTAVTWSWDAVSHNDTGQSINYSLDYSINGGNWVFWTDSLSSTTATMDFTNSNIFPWGCSVKIRCKSYDGYEYSGYSESALIYKDNPPSAPTVTYPVNGKTVYDTTPRIAVTINSDQDSGQRQELRITWNNVVYNSNNDSHKQYFSVSGTFSSGDKVVFTPPTSVSADSTSKSITVCTYDGFVESSYVTTYVTVKSLDTYSITSGQTFVLADMISNMRPQINNVRAAYGLSDYPFTSITAGSTIITKNIFTELQTAINDVSNAINNYNSGGSNQVTQSYTPITSGSTIVISNFLNEIYSAIKNV